MAQDMRGRFSPFLFIHCRDLTLSHSSKSDQSLLLLYNVVFLCIGSLRSLMWKFIISLHASFVADMASLKPLFLLSPVRSVFTNERRSDRLVRMKYSIFHDKSLKGALFFIFLRENYSVFLQYRSIAKTTKHPQNTPAAKGHQRCQFWRLESYTTPLREAFILKKSQNEPCRFYVFHKKVKSQSALWNRIPRCGQICPLYFPLLFFLQSLGIPIFFSLLLLTGL